MISSESAELADMFDRVFVGQFGGRASVDEVYRAVLKDLPNHLRDYLVATGLKTKIGTHFRKRNSIGLPAAPEVNAQGVHVQLDMMSVEEFRYCVQRQCRDAETSKAQAHRYAQLCAEVHGELIDVAAELAKAGTARRATA